ncbi:MAG: PfkB family carbohydrate kinase [Puniceicoccales bacterium]|nr:PfkB family carbohydrate kinase [Puniceicoccales bacterium]
MATLGKIAGEIGKKYVVAGFDGFIDAIVHAVDVRDGDSYTRIDTIFNFGSRIVAAAGKSTNIELVPQKKLVGGNGPIMAGAMHNFGANVQYIGALGIPVSDIFADFAAKTHAVSIGNYGETHAVEFSDGKIIFGEMLPLCRVGVANLLDKMPEEDLVNAIDQCDAFALVNWTMMPHLDDIARFFWKEILPKCSQRKRLFFFDLADPRKRKQSDLAEFLQVIRSFEQFGRSILGLNVSEAQQVLQTVAGTFNLSEREEEMRRAAEFLRESLGISLVFIHGIEMSAAAVAGKSSLASGYFVENPQISTGAGDHYNAGFLAAYLCENDINFAINFAAATAAFYVKTGRSPSLTDIKIL